MSRTTGAASGDPGGGAIFLLLPVAVLYYGFLLTAGGGIALLAPLPHGLTFNSMLLHLLQGRFDVDPAVIGNEGYLRDGTVYTYFGILPALLRAPALVLADFATTELTRLSCLAAVSLMASFKLLAALTVWRHAAPPPRAASLRPLLVAAILFSGPQVEFLRPSIFVETILWSAALAAAFVYLLLRGWLCEEGFNTALLTALATVAGLCLLTRVSTALSLYAALGLILLWRYWRERRLGTAVLPGTVLLGFAAIAGVVNYQRWGNPLVFVDLSRSLMLAEFPDRAARLAQYGEFNPVRLGFGFVYYFFPIWVLRDASGRLLWSDFVERTLDSAELPPSTFLLTDPLLVALAVGGAVALARGSVPRRMPVVLAAIGFSVPIGLVLIALYMAFRYRMEFYPLIELLAFVALLRLLARPSRGATVAFACGTAASIIGAHAAWLLNAMSPFGPAAGFLGDGGIVEFYRSVLQ